jgi:two-component system response regulator AgrA
MVRFVIVDDDRDEILHIKSLLDEVVTVDKEIVYFHKLNEELKNEIKNTDIRKVYILDIELNDKVSGINIAKLIRDVDYENEILFITNHDGMFESVHRGVYEVFDFIEKFHDFDKRFKKDIKAIIKRNFDNKMFNYKVLSIYYREIMYIYTDDRKLIIVTSNNEYTVNMTIKEIMTMLDSRFRQCHKSCIVNTDHIEKKDYKNGFIILNNGMKVDYLSKKFMKELDK